MIMAAQGSDDAHTGPVVCLANLDQVTVTMTVTVCEPSLREFLPGDSD
jgi:hypothetical protein